MSSEPSQEPGKPGRPAVCVIVPFAGGEAEAARMIEALSALDLRPGDRILIADNCPVPLFGGRELPAGIEACRASGRQSSYFARNVAAREADSPWLLFCDADTEPPPDLLDRYFAEPIPADVGVVAGGVAPAPAATAAARYAASRGQISERPHLREGPLPAGITANLLVRRAAWEAVGGFEDEVRSGADLVFCWRVQERGMRLIHRPGAVLRHHHPESAEAMLAKARRHAAGRAWVNSLYPGALRRPRVVRPLLRAPLVAAWWLARGQRERAAFKLLDMRWSAAMLRGYYRGDNRAPSPGGSAE